MRWKMREVIMILSLSPVCLNLCPGGRVFYKVFPWSIASGEGRNYVSPPLSCNGRESREWAIRLFGVAKYATEKTDGKSECPRVASEEIDKRLL